MDPETAPAPETTAPPSGGTSAPAGQPASTAPDDGQESFSREEAARLRRNDERLRGMSPIVEAAQKSGFKSPEDFANYQKAMAVLSQRNMSLEQVAQLLGDDGTRAVTDGDDAAQFDPEEFKKSMFTEFRTEQAMSQHSAAETADLALVRDLSALGLNKDTPESVRKTLTAAAESLYWQSRSDYEEGHPLRDKHLAPMGREGVAKVHASLKESLSHLSGAQLAELGKAASAGTVSTAAAKAGAADGISDTESRPKSRRELIRDNMTGRITGAAG